MHEAAGLLLAEPTSTRAYVETTDEPVSCGVDDCPPVGLPVARRSPSDVVVRSESDHDTVVAISEQYDDGWHVTVDGSSAEVLAVDGIQIGVMVPAGAHEVHFTYRPDGLTMSIVVSILATLGALALVVFDHVAGDRFRTWRKARSG